MPELWQRLAGQGEHVAHADQGSPRYLMPRRGRRIRRRWRADGWSKASSVFGTCGGGGHAVCPEADRDDPTVHCLCSCHGLLADRWATATDIVSQLTEGQIRVLVKNLLMWTMWGPDDTGTWCWTATKELDPDLADRVRRRLATGLRIPGIITAKENTDEHQR